ncbi:band 4.1-like protein 3 isoform X2 [Paramacrobiotus metropolitanus]|nr:band 4.1-like protein 3 isoform X2 [Paramacrobiotus metropolitanus]
MDASLKKQLKDEWYCEFRLKFYPPTPESLKDDLTKYHIFLQIHRDLVTNKLPATTEQYVFLGALTVVSELGDFNPAVHHGNYASRTSIAPSDIQNAGMEHSVMALHQTFPRGMKLEQIENEYLQFARKLPLYGVTKYEVKNGQNRLISLGVSSSGLREYEANTLIATYPWHHILKFSYRRHTFYIDVRSRPSPTQDAAQERKSYSCVSEKAAKRLWKTSTEHHSFFRGFPKTKADEDLFRRRSFRMPVEKRKDPKITGTVVTVTEEEEVENMDPNKRATTTVVRKGSSSEDDGIFFTPRQTMSQPTKPDTTTQKTVTAVVRSEGKGSGTSGSTTTRTVVTRIMTTDQSHVSDKYDDDTKARDAVYASIHDVLHKKHTSKIPTTTVVTDKLDMDMKKETSDTARLVTEVDDGSSDTTDDEWAFKRAVQDATGLSADVRVIDEIQTPTKVKNADSLVI